MSFSQENNNCAGTAFVQGDSVGGSKLTEQTILVNSKPDHLPVGDSHVLVITARGSGFPSAFFARGEGGLRFWIREIFYSSGRKM